MTSLKSTNTKASASAQDDVSALGDWDDREERRLVRKMDFRCLVGRFFFWRVVAESRSSSLP